MRAKKVDANQHEIVASLRKMGVSAIPGHDDILVGWRGRTFWYEIKNKDGRNRIQPSQQLLVNTFQGHYRVVSCLDDILVDLGIIDKT